MRLLDFPINRKFWLPTSKFPMLLAMLALLKVAVLGTGSLGKEHARLYADLAAGGRIEFVGVHDRNPEAARRVAEKTGATVFATMDEAAAAADALSIVTPTVTHF